MADYTLTKTGAQLDAIGEIAFISAGQTSLASNTEVNLCSFSLTPGVWIVTSYFRISRGGENCQASVSISTTSGSSETSLGGYTQFPLTSETTIAAVGTTRLLNLTQTTTVYLVGWQSGSSAKTVYRSQMQAVRIK